MKKPKIRSSANFALIYAAILLVAPQAKTQEAAATPVVSTGASKPGTTGGSLEQIIVTGTNLPTAVEATAQPMQTLDRTAIDETGRSTISQLLQTSVPQVGGSGNYRGDQVNNPGGGEANVALRGLPAQDTLVLVNGKRMPRTSTPSLNSLGFNINTIPLGAVERVDILREGASPVYGSDAVAGVINIILRDQFEGAQLDGQYGITDKGDAETYVSDFISGIKTDRLSLVVTGSYYRQNGIKNTDRDYLASANQFNNSGAGIDARSSANNPARIFIPGDPNGASIRLNSGVAFGPGTTLDDYHPFDGSPTGTDRFDYSKVGSLTLDIERWGFTTNLVYKLTESGNVRFRFEGLFDHTVAEDNSAATPIFSDGEAPVNVNGTLVPISVPPTNVWYRQLFGTGGTVNADYYYRMFEFGNRVTTTYVDTYRLCGGLEGELFEGRVRWNVGGLYTLETSEDHEDGLVNKRELLNQVNNSDPAVASFNPFANEQFNFTGNQRLASDRLHLLAINHGDSELWELSGNVNGDIVQLPAGYITAGLGVAYREESLNKTPDTNVAAFNTIGTTNQLATIGSRQVTSVYGEIFVPFVSADMKVPFVYALDGRVALRFEDYSDFGSTVKPGFTLRYRPAEELTFRANYSEGFTVPPLQYLFQGFSESFDAIINPLDPTETQARALRAGNPHLNPTNSKSFDIGVIWTPSFIPEEFGRLTLRADYWYIEKSGDINIPTTQSVVDRFFAGDPTVQHDVSFAANGKTISSVLVQYSNFNVSTRIRGIDFGGDYQLPLKHGALGKITAGADFTYLLKYNDQYGQEAGKDRFGGVGFSGSSAGSGALPQMRGIVDLGYSYNTFQILGTFNYISYYEEINALVFQNTGATQFRKVHDYPTFDFQTSYTFTGRKTDTVSEPGGKQVVDGKGKVTPPESTRTIEHLEWYHDLTITLGVLNAFDEHAPFVSNINGSFDANLADPIGRFFYVRVTKKF